MISDIDFERLTLDVCQVARQAGDYIRNEHANFSVDKVERKHAHDYVSYVDKGSEQMIVKALRELLPQAGFITEEGTTKDDAVANLPRGQVPGINNRASMLDARYLSPWHISREIIL